MGKMAKYVAIAACLLVAGLITLRMYRREIDRNTHRRSAIARLASAGACNDRALVGELDTYLADPDPQIRREAVRTASIVGADSAKIVSRLTDENVDVRLQATQALTKTTNSAAIKALAIRVKTDPDSRVRLAAVTALLHRIEPEAIEAVKAAQSDPEVAVRAVAGAEPEQKERAVDYRAADLQPARAMIAHRDVNGLERELPPCAEPTRLMLLDEIAATRDPAFVPLLQRLRTRPGESGIFLVKVDETLENLKRTH